MIASKLIQVYLIVNFEVGASDLKFVVSLLLGDKSKYRLEAKDHQTWIIWCPRHSVCLSTVIKDLKTNVKF